MTTRQQRRGLQREYIKLGRAAFATGLTARPPREVVLGVALSFKSKLTERKNPRRASEAARLAHGLVERSIAARPGTSAIACRKGCAYCCHSYVGLLPPEVFLLADAVRAQREPETQVAVVRERCGPLKELCPQDRVGRKLPCPLLVDGQCSVYAARPTVCRQTTSLALQACVDEFENRNPHATIPVSPLHLAYCGAVYAALLGGLRAAGLPGEAYELSAALDLALAMPDAEQRWLGGEAVFGNLAPAPRPSELEHAASRIAEDIGA